MYGSLLTGGRPVESLISISIGRSDLRIQSDALVDYTSMLGQRQLSHKPFHDNLPDYQPSRRIGLKEVV